MMVADFNPYPGPRPFDYTREDIDRFFGRTKEQRDIVSLLIAQRTLLLYGKSGTGKTSLLNAGIMPELVERGFQVLDVARVQGVMAPGQESQPVYKNIYVANVLLGWDDKMSHENLSDYLAGIEHLVDEDGFTQLRIVIFDQFEELFTAYPHHWEHRRAFFEQIRDALQQDENLRVIFVMREDFIAEIDSYATVIPNRLKVRYRLEQLRPIPARQAIEGPLDSTDRYFSEGAAEHLVNKLLTARNPEPGDPESFQEEFVEPVVLQVVCNSLWERIEADAPQLSEIAVAEVDEFARVDDALIRFYEECLETACLDPETDDPKFDEGVLRAWFETHLITSDNTRNVLHPSDIEAQEIPSEIIDELQNLHIIRGELRGRSVWYELVHDRFIDPIKVSNREWRESLLAQQEETPESVRSQYEPPTAPAISKLQEDQEIDRLAEKTLENTLWEAANLLRRQSGMRPSEYTVPVLGLILFRYLDDDGYQYLLGQKDFAYLGEDLNSRMRALEDRHLMLRDALSHNYDRFDNKVLANLLELFAEPFEDRQSLVSIFDYFLPSLAQSEGQRGGEFFTPTSLVRLIAEIIEPLRGRIFDPACGSGGMFIQAANFINGHGGYASEDIEIFGQENVDQTVQIAKMNLAMHDLQADIQAVNSYYEDPFGLNGRFDFAMCNPPFNVGGIDLYRLEGDPRFPFGIPTADNANYLWIQLIYAALNEAGRAGSVMANSAGDARGSEAAIREQLIRTGAVDAIVAIGSNFFYNVTLPCTLWFVDRAKERSHRQDSILFINARDIYTQVDRTHREFSPKQIEFISNIVRLFRENPVETSHGSTDLLFEMFPDSAYQDVLGICKAATLDEIEAQGWSLNPGRYVGVAPRIDEVDFDFRYTITELSEQLTILNAQAQELQEQITQNLKWLLENNE